MAADKAKEQELKSRTREVIMSKQEQMHITHEQVKMVFDVKLWLLPLLILTLLTSSFCILGTGYQRSPIEPLGISLM